MDNQVVKIETPMDFLEQNFLEFVTLLLREKYGPEENVHPTYNDAAFQFRCRALCHDDGANPNGRIALSRGDGRSRIFCNSCNKTLFLQHLVEYSRRSSQELAQNIQQPNSDILKVNPRSNQTPSFSNYESANEVDIINKNILDSKSPSLAVPSFGCAKSPHDMLENPIPELSSYPPIQPDLFDYTHEAESSSPPQECLSQQIDVGANESSIPLLEKLWAIWKQALTQKHMKALEKLGFNEAEVGIHMGQRTLLDSSEQSLERQELDQFILENPILKSACFVFPCCDQAGGIINFVFRPIRSTETQLDNQQLYASDKVGKYFLLKGVSRSLYGLKTLSENIDNLTICEGVKDFLRLKSRFKNVIATLGGLSREQASHIKGLANNLILAYDNDSAGKNHTVKAIFLLEGKNIQILELPIDKDPGDCSPKEIQECPLSSVSEWQTKYGLRIDKSPQIIMLDENDEDPMKNHEFLLKDNPFPEHIFDEGVESYLRKSAQVLGLDYPSAALSFLGHIAVAIGNSRRVEITLDDIEKPIIWLAIVGPTGCGKSPLLQYTGCKQISLIEESNEMEHQVKLDEYYKALDEYNLLSDDKKDEQFPNGEPRKPADAERYVMKAGSIEGLFYLHSINPNGISIVVDELQTMLDGLNQYKSRRGGNDKYKLLEIWNGYPLSDDLVGNTRKLHDPCVSILGGIQPTFLEKIINAQNVTDGFASRFIYTFLNQTVPLMHPKEKAKIAKSITDVERNYFFTLFKNLTKNRRKKIIYKFSKKAADLLWDYHYELEQEAFNGEPELYSPVVKLKTYSKRTALVLQALGQHEQDGFIQEEVMIKNIRLIKFLKRNTLRAFHTVFQNDVEKKEAKIIQKIEKLGGKVKPEKIKDALRKTFGNKRECGKFLEQMTQKRILIKVKEGKESFVQIRDINT